METGNFHYDMKVAKQKGNNPEGESGPPGVYFVVTNKNKVILFFCIIPMYNDIQ